MTEDHATALVVGGGVGGTPDEHPWIERFGCTARYRHLCEGALLPIRIDNLSPAPGTSPPRTFCAPAGHDSARGQRRPHRPEEFRREPASVGVELQLPDVRAH